MWESVALHHLGRPEDALSWIHGEIGKLELDLGHAGGRSTDALAAAYTVKSLILCWSGRHDAAEQLARETIARFPQAGTTDLAALMLVKCCHARGEFAAAERLVRERLRHASTNLLMQHCLAETLAEQEKDLVEALRLALHCVQQQPDNSDFIDTLAWTLFKARNYDEALEYHRRATEAERINPVQLARMGHCLLKVGRLHEAHSNWEQARDLLRARPNLDPYETKMLSDVERLLATR
jgi:tetratricopeptide (TPR) repeat protein